MPQLTGVQASPGEIHGTDTYDLPTFGVGFGSLCAAIFYGRARPTPVLSSVMFGRWIVCRCCLERCCRIFGKRPKSASTYLAIRLSTHFIAGNVAFPLVVARVGSKCHAKHRPGCTDEHERHNEDATFRHLNKRFRRSGQLPDLTGRASPSAARYCSAHSLRADFRAASCIVAQAARAVPCASVPAKPSGTGRVPIEDHHHKWHFPKSLRARRSGC